MKKDFIKNARFCENFNPGDYLEQKGDLDKLGYVELTLNDNLVLTNDERCLQIYVPDMYIPLSGYIAWLKSVYEDAYISEENVDIRSFNDEQHIFTKVCVHLDKDIVISAFGESRFGKIPSITGKTEQFLSVHDAMIFSYADAVKNALRRYGFGEGLDWDSMKMELPRYICVSEDGATSFIEYDGDIISNSIVLNKENTVINENKDETSIKKVGVVENIDAESSDENSKASGTSSILNLFEESSVKEDESIEKENINEDDTMIEKDISIASEEVEEKEDVTDEPSKENDTDKFSKEDAGEVLFEALPSANSNLLKLNGTPIKKLSKTILNMFLKPNAKVINHITSDTLSAIIAFSS